MSLRSFLIPASYQAHRSTAAKPNRCADDGPAVEADTRLMRSSAVSDRRASAAAQPVKLCNTYGTRLAEVDAPADVDVTIERRLAAVIGATVRQPGIGGRTRLGNDHRHGGLDLGLGGYRHPAGSDLRHPARSSP